MGMPEPVWGHVEAEVGFGEGFEPDVGAEPAASDVSVGVHSLGGAGVVLACGAAGGAVGGDGVLAVAAPAPAGAGGAAGGAVGGDGVLAVAAPAPAGSVGAGRAVAVGPALVVRFGPPEGLGGREGIGDGVPAGPGLVGHEEEQVVRPEPVFRDVV